jgi:hypothetical protein
MGLVGAGSRGEVEAEEEYREAGSRATPEGRREVENGGGIGESFISVRRPSGSDALRRR